MTNEHNEEKPALTIVIKSWWTPVLAVLMLAVGLLGGYFGRPLLDKGGSKAETTPESSQSVSASPTSAPSGTIPDIQTADELMTYLISQTRHFRGDPEAPVTIIEFSDFQ